MKPAEKNKIESLLMTAYKLPYSATIFENDYALSRQQQMQHNNCKEATNVIEKANQVEEQEEGKTNGDSDDNDDEDNNNDDDDDDEEDDEEDATTTTTTAETISSYQNVLTITNIQMQQRKKHPRKPQNRLIVTR